jgi:hypothetical protein
MKISKQFDDALQFAAQLHREQTRKATTTPYISHLMAVAGLVMEFGGNEDQAIAALLHDAIEDQSEGFGGPDKLRTEIVRRYGTSVLSIIDAGTDADTVPKRPWEERKTAYIEHIPAMAADAALVSICDKLHNARSIVVDYLTLGDAIFERFNAGKDRTLWYYAEVTKSFMTHHRQPASGELDRVVAALLALTRAPATAELQHLRERPPFMPDDAYEKWQLPPDAAGADIAVFHNTTTKKYWLRYDNTSFGSPFDGDLVGVIWGEVTSDEAVNMSSSTARLILQARRVLLDKDGALTVRPAVR